MKNSFVIFILLFTHSFFSVRAQDFTLKGVVFERGTNNRMAQAQVFNLRTKVGVSSNAIGLFEINVAVGDTLQISKMNFTDQFIPVLGHQDVIVKLVQSSTMLNEVTIVGQTKKQELDDIKRDFRRNGSFYAGKPPLLSYIFTPFTAIYELFGKTPKNARRFGKYADNEIKQSQIDQYFNNTTVQNNTDLRGENLEKFMIDYRPEYEKAQNWNSYDYIKYIRESAKKFTDTLGKIK